ncbi:MAG: hypothetical protein LBU08_00165 [Tannerellaceae bacterium]|jgi:hypothetical protein|nr:hypothetical protein [Tannerellaceae bacterium]
MGKITKAWGALAAGVMAVAAQQTRVEMAVEPAAILIGEQAVVTVTVTADTGREVKVLLPVDTLMAGIEIVDLSGWDTSVIGNGRVTMRQELVITSFDSSLYLLPPIMAVDLTDTVLSNQEALKVSTVPDVDVEHPENFFDIKKTWIPPFVWKDYLGYLLWFLLALALGGAVWYALKRWRQHKSLLPQQDLPDIPPHERAFNALTQIKQQKLWQQGMHKEYHTLVTDTLREYISERFRMEAMEMTSGEILDGMRGQHDAVSVYHNLEQILTLADFVKFAKKLPLPDENDLAMVNAFLFVEQTKPAEIVDKVQTED